MYHSCLVLQLLKLCVADNAARSRLAEESGFARMSTQRPASATGERPPPILAPLNMAAIPPFQVHFLLSPTRTLREGATPDRALGASHASQWSYSADIGWSCPWKSLLLECCTAIGRSPPHRTSLGADPSDACKASRKCPCCAVVLMQDPVAVH